MDNKNNSLVSWLILLVLVLVWGSSFILIKKSLLYFTGPEVGILRIVITFLFMMPFALRKIKHLSLKMGLRLLLSGFIGSLIPSFMFAIAQTGIDSNLAGTLNSLTPLFTLAMGLAFFKLKSRWYNILGVFIGLIGAIGLIYVNGSKGFAFNINYAALVIVATICYAFNVNYIKVYLKELDSLTITTFTFFFIGIPSLIYVLAWTDIPQKIFISGTAWAGLGYLSVLAIVGTGLALIAFNKLIKMSSPVFASSVTYLIPVVAIIWGVIDGEIFKPSYLLWFLLIIIGVFLVNASPYRLLNISSRLLFGKRAKN